MKSLIAALVVIVLIVVAVGFYQGWFTFTKTDDPAENKTKYGVTVDKEKIKDDIDKVKGKAQDIGDKAKDKLNKDN